MANTNELTKEKNTSETSISKKSNPIQKLVSDTSIENETEESPVITDMFTPTQTEMNQEELTEMVDIAKEKGFEYALKFMNDKIHATKQLVEIHYELKCFQHEGAYAISKAVEKVLGVFNQTSTGGMSGDKIPELISVSLPNGEEVKVPWGRIQLPGFDDECYIDLDYDYEDTTITVHARIRKKFEPDIRKVIDMTNEILAKEALYLAQAIELDFDEDDYANEPSFMDLSTIDENKILFSKDILDGLIPILARIKETEKCRKEGLDIKLGVLMEGIYGTGKTLTAFWLGKIAREFGWTFIYVKECKHSAKALKIAENYARNGNGVILFTEDIDQVLRGERGERIQEIVNTLDGGDTKNLPIISIFTTNHIEVIEPTFLRGKRIGSLINFGVLDEETAKQFIDKLVVDKEGKSLMVEGDHTAAINSLCGIVPAFASEVIDKAKAYMIHRQGNQISNEDIVSAADSYKKQIQFAECRAIKQHDSVSDALQILGKELFSNKGGNEEHRAVMQKITDVFRYMEYKIK